MHKDYLAERAVELALAMNKQLGDHSSDPIKNVDGILEDAGKILAFMQNGAKTDEA